MPVENGLIVLADVSGYTEFIATTELDHSREIMGELLGTLCECAPGSLTIAQIEGDAVFWLCDQETPALVALLKEKFVEFHRRLRFMNLATTCPCRACASVGSLTLKFVVHRGSYVRQRVAGSDHFVGIDLVLAHRLLKNTVPSHEYILLTDAALASVTADGAVRHEETIEHIGTIPCAYIELSDVRRAALAERTDHLAPGDAQAATVRTFPASVERVRDAMRDEGAAGPRGAHYQLLEDPPAPVGGAAAGSRILGGDPTHELTRDGARGSVLGQEIHCHHEGAIEVMRLIKSDRDQHGSVATTHLIGTHRTVYLTQILSETPTGSRIEVRLASEPVGDPASQLPPSFLAIVEEHLDRIAAAVAGAGGA